VFEKLMPKEIVFFDYFERMAAKILEGCTAVLELLEDCTNVAEKARRIKVIEHEGDLITHQCIEMLHKTFITPFDRDSIHRLITKMDDILDLAEAVSDRISVYEMASPTDEARQLARVLVFSVEEVSKAVRGLRNMKNAESILSQCVEINRLENEADTLLRVAVGKLFKTERDPLMVMKWKELYEGLEEATDRCEDVANLVEGIVLEFA
jgi:predicted phosphate transport protein (TIGR00153 family)